MQELNRGVSRSHMVFLSDCGESRSMESPLHDVPLFVASSRWGFPFFE